MYLRLTVATVVVFGLPLNGIAQSQVDEVCSTLIRERKTGLFRPTARPEQPYEAVNGKKLDYRDDGRFYFVPRYNAGEEGAWHIRTQTVTAEPRGADRIFLDRPFTDTRCSRKRGTPLQLLVGDDRYYNVSNYAQHHGPGETDGRRWDHRDYPTLSRRFHFELEDQPASKGCVSTDDPEAFNQRNWTTYGFAGVAPEPSRQQLSLTWSGTAVAQPLPKYDGLSSEFRYYDGPGPVCLSFVAPISTLWGDRMAANRRPVSTLIVIQRLQARTKPKLETTTVRWN